MMRRRREAQAGTGAEETFGDHGAGNADGGAGYSGLCHIGGVYASCIDSGGVDAGSVGRIGAGRVINVGAVSLRSLILHLLGVVLSAHAPEMRAYA